MQIDRHNFHQHYQTIKQNLQKATFVSFDCQFTGLVTNLQKIQGIYSNHKQFYERIKQTALNFKILQLGLTAFIYDQNQHVYQPHTYNFYILPFVNTKHFNNVMIAQVQSLQFLSKHGMNWNKVLQCGIVPQRLIQPFQYQYHHYDQHKYQKGQYFYSQKDTQFIQRLKHKLQRLSYENIIQKIDFQKDIILREFQNIYQERLILKKDKKTTKRYQFQVSLMKKIQKENQDDIQFIKHEVKQVQQEPKYVQKKNQQSIQKLLKVIIDKKLPIIGYFPNLDLGLIYHTFFASLPQEYQDFSKQFIKLFPRTYDVKIISRDVQRDFKGLKANVKGLYQACFNKRLLGPYTNLKVLKSQKDLQNSNCHQAGYDAYITGIAFLGMMNYLTRNQKGQPLNFIQFDQQYQYQNLIYSKHTGVVSLTYPYCRRTQEYQKRIIVWDQIQGKQKRKEIGNLLAEYGTLCVREDHQQVYFVYEEQNNHIQLICDKYSKEYGLKNYHQRRIPKARNMYQFNQQQYKNV